MDGRFGVQSERTALDSRFSVSQRHEDDQLVLHVLVNAVLVYQVLSDAFNSFPRNIGRRKSLFTCQEED